MRLSVRLIALGVTGPIVGLGIFLVLSASTVVELAQKAKFELTTLFDQDNRTNLLFTTSIIQRNTRMLAAQLDLDSQRLAKRIGADLNLSPTGQMSWQRQPLEPAQAPQRLNPILAMPLTLPTESASIFLKDGQNIWRRLAGVDGKGHPLPAGWVPPAATVRELEEVIEGSGARLEARNTMLLRDGLWRMSRLTPLPAPGGAQRLLLSVSLRTDADNEVLQTSARLFPYKNHHVAFFGFSTGGRLYCNFAQPSQGSCPLLHRAMLASGGIPLPSAHTQALIGERSILIADRPGETPERQRLFMATFPEWNWLAVILVEEAMLNRKLVPLRQATETMLILLVLGTLLLVAGCALAAWRIAAGIQRELGALAAAADRMAAGDSRTQLSYGGDDALGRLVQAFNRMSGAVADREDSFKERIRTLEIDINQQVLQGQVCSITRDPHFLSLSERAEAMRTRRQQRRKSR
ncbi:HAMP domain-containing protein [Cyanobium sp. Morenito 9A2]|uniref:HAMP domain-containing protein n=1 Tax=Cyanobium sp. Morenito 9A2 TaxID=2823718 RepID=UPI0020CCE11E|nr:HAMP domain-containing protein [Cyanobium sp. Morenito 9A2]MCP9849919.1 HAMP domain-containing protein [Cyanobium sp. Morenito 9A2]